MSKKIYACLLRLFPSAFRRHYEEESLQLLRDLLHDEKGFLRRLRLSFDPPASEGSVHFDAPEPSSTLKARSVPAAKGIFSFGTISPPGGAQSGVQSPVASYSEHASSDAVTGPSAFAPGGRYSRRVLQEPSETSQAGGLRPCKH
jgi:hypothetical protein